MLNQILSWVINACFTQGLATLGACAASAAVLLATLIAGIGLTIVQTKSRTMAGNVGLTQISVRRINLYILVGARHHCRAHGLDEG